MGLPNPYYTPGDWNAICDRCGRAFKASQMRKTWDNLYTCRPCWEPRHPQDFVKGKQERPMPPWVRPRPDPFADPPPNLGGGKILEALFLPPQQPKTRWGEKLVGRGAAPLYFGDPLFGSVLLLLTAQAGLTTDSSSFGRAMSEAGAVAVDAAKPLEGKSTYNKQHGGGVSNNRLSLTDGDSFVNAMGSSEFCLEFYYNHTTDSTGDDRLMSLASLSVRRTNAGAIIAFVVADSSSISVGSPDASAPLDTWKHIALIRDNTTDASFSFLRLFIGGELVNSSTSFGKTHSLNGSVDTFPYPLGFNSISPGGSFGSLRLTQARRYMTNSQGEAITSFTPDLHPFAGA